MAIDNPNTNTASFGTTAQNKSVVLTLADTVLTDTPSNTELIVTAGANPLGALVTSLTATPRATVTATRMDLFISSDTGTTQRLWASVLMEAHTVAATTAIPSTAFTHPDGTAISADEPLRLKTGETLYVGAGVALAGGIVVVSSWTDG